MLVVLDTNQYVSALIRRGGQQDDLLEAWRRRRFGIAISPALLSEVADVLHRPKICATYNLAAARISRFLAILEAQSMVVPSVVSVSAVSDDPDDNAVLACALEAQADYIISGDHHLLDLGSYQGIPIIRAATFLDLVTREDAP